MRRFEWCYFLSTLSIMISVLYYYYYLFYTKVVSDSQPHSTTIFTLSFSLSIVINGLLSLIAAYLSKYNTSNYVMVSVFIIIIIVNYLVFYRTGKGKKLVKERPKLFNNHKLSMLFTIIFFLITTSFLFWGPILIKNMLAK